MPGKASLAASEESRFRSRGTGAPARLANTGSRHCLLAIAVPAPLHSLAAAASFQDPWMHSIVTISCKRMGNLRNSVPKSSEADFPALPRNAFLDSSSGQMSVCAA
jgi:hypothetical protein